jgi:ABC-type oligopeptide transport system substrate-binding subunit
MRMLRALAALALAGAGSTFAIVAAEPAYASCAGTPPPAKTVFTGTVAATSHGGRQATVHTTDGRTVTVNGTPDLSAAATSVDRIFEDGATYEFHVLNDSAPYEDNACTATRQISAGNGMSGLSHGVIAAGGAVLVVAGAIAVLVWRRKHAGRAPAQPV